MQLTHIKIKKEHGRSLKDHYYIKQHTKAESQKNGDCVFYSNPRQNEMVDSPFQIRGALKNRMVADKIGISQQVQQSSGAERAGGRERWQSACASEYSNLLSL